ncbi:MAG: L-aspartate oxidase [Deltaproteobacteria bacterium]|nr:L-aspartate oxidase [Deltaproteobacteria bacterium]
MSDSVDFLVIGSGIAGLWFALQAVQHGTVRVITKDRPEESNTQYAQGGIAAVWSKEDSYEEHVQDTLIAGAGLCRREAVEVVVREGPDRVRELIDLGAHFTRHHDRADWYDLHREGGHSRRRILHADDFTGAEVVRALRAKGQAEGIRVDDHLVAIDLITERGLSRRCGEIPPAVDTVVGAYLFNPATGEVEVARAKVVVLATGGAGKTYLFTTNPSVATGDGMAMAWRAGAEMSNMEFVQFHPTALFHHTEKHFLISEALRGEGGKLQLPSGERFMAAYDPREELAPRDIVARAIDAEIKRHGLDHVCLDMRHLSREVIEERFPNIHAKLLSLGIDMAVDTIPVVPAAHYFCGGVRVDLDGATSIQHLYAIGETANTGLHGANRLASNSLLEATVFAERAAAHAGGMLGQIAEPREVPAWDVGEAVDSDEQVVILQVWEEIRRFMMNYVGIVRTHNRLTRARRRIRLVQDEIREYYWNFKLTADLIELRNIADVAEMVVLSAMQRRESRGLHYNLDFPEQDSRFIRDTVIQRRC